MNTVIDASVCVAALVDGGSDGQWAEALFMARSPSAPQLLLIESSSVLRRLVATGRLSDLDASAAHRDLLSLSVDLYPFEPVAERVWALRHNLGSYDACYVALAEALDVPLATLDRKLIDAPGSRCEFLSMGV